MKEVKLSVPSGTDLLSVPKDQIARFALQVVMQEGPIHGEEVARRIREAFGLARTGRRVLEAVVTALELCVWPRHDTSGRRVLERNLCS